MKDGGGVGRQGAHLSPWTYQEYTIRCRTPAESGHEYMTSGKKYISSVQFSHSACPTLCDPMNRSMPGLPVQHQLPEFTQTHVH